MSTFNLWISASGEFKSELWGYVRRLQPAVTFPVINDIDDRTREFFLGVYDEGMVEQLFKPWDAAGRTYKLWSVYSPKPDGTQIIRADLDMMIAAYPQDFGVLGAWDWDGNEVGNPPWYPIPNQTVNFMPDPSGGLVDVNLLVGQSPRSFASYGGMVGVGCPT